MSRNESPVTLASGRKTSLHFLARHSTGNVNFRRVTLVLYLCMWLLGSPDIYIVSFHLETHMECGFIAE